MLKRLFSCILCCCIGIFLAACNITPPTNTTFQSVRQGVRAGMVSPTAAVSLITMTIGNFREYPLPQRDSGLMRPAIDHEGRLWFGEMGHNYLAVFDPRTGSFHQMTPPHGRSGIMGIVVASDDTIWFAEQYANYIGHYFPHTRRYQMYPLPTLTIPDPGHPGQTMTLPSAPNDLALDTHGNLWCTELNADSLAYLDTHTGVMRQYRLSPRKTIQTLDPYGVTVDPQGMVWFTEASNNHLGRLDPITGTIRYFTMPGPVTALMEVASDSHGIIWATSFSNSLLLSFNPYTSTFTPYYAPTAGGSSGALYGLTVTPDNEIWVTVTSENAIARLDPAQHRFIYYRIPTPGSLPFGLIMGPAKTLWFTESGSDTIGQLQP